MECESDQKGLVEYVKKKASCASPFLLKTYMLVDDPATDGVVSWNAAGTAFVVWQTAEFARDLLPTLFKHNNFSSFVRQLNTYGFHKVSTNLWEFSNEMFHRGEKEKLCEIRRRRAWSNRQHCKHHGHSHHDHQSDHEDGRSSSTSSSSDQYLTSLICENTRLKQENGVLNSELAILRMKCTQLLHIYGENYSEEGEFVEEEEEEDYGKGPMLFGVRLAIRGGIKKKRKRTSFLLSHANDLK